MSAEATTADAALGRAPSPAEARARARAAEAIAADVAQRARAAEAQAVEAERAIRELVEALIAPLRGEVERIADGLRRRADELELDLLVLREQLDRAGTDGAPSPAPAQPPHTEAAFAPPAAPAPAPAAFELSAEEAGAALAALGQPPARPAPESAPSPHRGPRRLRPRRASGDVARARLVALSMALSGSPRAHTAEHLREHFRVPDLDAVLDEVFERAEEAAVETGNGP